MTLGERIDSLDLRAMAPALLVAAAAFIALYLLVERFDRIALAKPVSQGEWAAPKGNELRLAGLGDGPLIALETPEGGSLTVFAPNAVVPGQGPVQQLTWSTFDGPEADNKAQVQVSLAGKGGSVALRRFGDAVASQLLLRVENASLEVTTGATIGEAGYPPKTRIVADGKDLQPTGPGFRFTVPPGGTVTMEFPASGVSSLLGGIRAEDQDIVLSVREVGIYREDATSPDLAICAARNNNYAWAPFFRLSLFPVPNDSDCISGPLTGRGFEIDPDSVTVNLAGSGWQMKEGKPTASLLTWVGASPVLSLLVNWGVPGAVAWIFGLVTWRRRAPVEPVPEAKGKSAPKPGPRSRRSR